MVTWGGVAHPIWNAVAALIWVTSIVAVVLVPTERFAKGWRTKVFWVLLTGAAFYASGYYFPVGAFFGFGTARYFRRRLAPGRPTVT